VAARHICDDAASNPYIAQSGREGLESLHERGVLHGDVKNRLNAMVSVSDNNVIWLDFSMGEINANISDNSFARKAS
jgi:tRNA A-37 threonylcarbamoyl transferase component Bud32